MSTRRTKDRQEDDSKKDEHKSQEEGMLILFVAAIVGYAVWRIHGGLPILPGIAGPHIVFAPPRWLVLAATMFAIVALVTIVLLVRRWWRRRLARRVGRALLEAGVEGRHPTNRERTIKPRLRKLQHESRYVWKLAFAMPVMGSSLNLSRLVPHLEGKLDCSITPWAEDRLVWLRIGTRKLPRRTGYEDFDHQLLEGKQLPISVGTSREGDLAIDLATLPHMLLGGKTGGGKSVFLRQALVRLVCERSPEELRLVLADLKGGMEFTHFRHLPHLMCPVVDAIADFADAMQTAYQELDRRMQVFREAGVESLAGWNDEHPEDRLPYVVIVVDELAEITIKSSSPEESKLRQANVAFLSHISRL
ncbi:MAG: FtsK/SpoIIIE domain-containing protein, partial [Candidatus Dormibacteraceae bacterium]